MSELEQMRQLLQQIVVIAERLDSIERALARTESNLVALNVRLED